MQPLFKPLKKTTPLRYLQRLFFSLTLLCASPPLQAQEAFPFPELPPLDLSSLDLPSLLSVEWLSENDGRDDLFIDLDLSIGGPRLLFSVAQSQVDSEFSHDSTRSYLVGIYNDPLQTLNFGAELRHWGLEDNIRSIAAQGFFAYNSRNWTLALRPQVRLIDFTTSDFCRQFSECPDEWRVNSRGLSIDGSYYLGAWSFTLGASSQNYDRDLRPLATRPLIIRRFTPLSLALATGFEDYGVNVGLSYAFRGGLLSLSEYRSVSAVDGLASWLTSLRLSIDLNPQWSLSLNGGLLRMPEFNDSNSAYAGLGLMYSW